MTIFHPQKSSKHSLKARILTLSFHCITLALICQAFWPFSPVSAASGVNNFYLENYTADYYLSKTTDGHSKLRVVEEFTAIFPNVDQNHGITRVIPYTNQAGENLTMASDQKLNIQVFRNSQPELPYQIENGDGYFRVYIGNPSSYVHGQQVYRLEYEFQNVITDFDEWQELYWDTNGNDWQQDFGQVTATVHFDSDEIAKAYRGESSCYVGLYGENNQSRCKITQLDQSTIQFVAKDLTGGENLTFDLEFQGNIFAIPEKIYDYRILQIVLAEVAIIILLLVWLGYLLHQTAAKRKFYRDYFVKPEYTPPKGFTVAEMSENYLRGSTTSSKAATLIELAVTGKVELIKKEYRTKLGRTATIWKIHIKSIDLKPEQTIILQILTGARRTLAVGQEIEIRSHTATNELIKLSTDFDAQLKGSNEQQGLRVKKAEKGKPKPPRSHGGVIIVNTAVLAFASFMFLLALIDRITPYRPSYGGTPLTIIAFILPWVIMVAAICFEAKFAAFFDHTEKGLEYSRYLDGLKLYIQMAEKDRIDFLQSVKGADTSPQGVVKLYEKLLPYAMIFKLEKSWLNELGKYYEMQNVDTPAWYVGTGVFSAREFNNAIMTASHSISSSIAHSTTSSSSSGSSGGGGGGFSGGGGGGGGGGGW